jgi:DNA-binding winged helix-turn-helix (wHTH) protein
MTFVFEDCEMNCDRRELRRKGTVMHVEPQVFDVLVHLVQQRDRVVSKDSHLDIDATERQAVLSAVALAATVPRP